MTRVVRDSASADGNRWTKLGAARPLLLAVCAIASLGFFATTASAAVSRPFERGFGVSANSPHAIAVDDEGNSYIVGIGSPQRVEKYDADGNPAPFSGTASYIEGNSLVATGDGPFSFETSSVPTGVAVDDSSGPNRGYIYVNANFDRGGGAYAFAPSGEYKGFIADPPGGYWGCGVAVDQSGRLYLAAGYGGRVGRFVAGGPNASDYTLESVLEGSGAPCATAVDSAGAVYEFSIFGGLTKYPASQFGQSPAVGTELYPGVGPVEGSQPLGIDLANDHLYTDFGDHIVETDPAGAPVEGSFGQGDFVGTSKGLAVGPGGEVYATDTSGEVSIYGPGPEVDLPVVGTGESSGVDYNHAALAGSVDPDGAGPVTGCRFKYGPDYAYDEGTAPCVPAASPGSPLTSPTSVSAQLAGLTAGTVYHYRLFADGANGTQAGHDGTFTTPPAVADLATEAATAVSKDRATLNGSFTGIGKETAYYFEYGPTPAYGSEMPAAPGDAAGAGTGKQVLDPIQVTGLQGATEYHFRVVAENEYGTTRGPDMTFVTDPAVTNLSADPASEVKATSATLHGSFDGDSYDTTYYFEYGPTANYGSTTPAPPGNDAGTGSGRVQVAPVTIEGLQQGAKYHYRIVATNSRGTTRSADATFRTADRPAVTQFSAEKVTATSAELTASINPRDGDTHYRFEYGPTTSYESVAPVPDEDIGAGNVDVPVSQTITLTSGVTYHFRVVAENEFGTEVTGDQSFGFYPSACPNSKVRQETGSNRLPDCRAYEIASAANANGTTIFPATGPNTGYGTHPAKLAYGGAFGTIPGSGDPINSIGDLYVATRTAEGWVTKYSGLGADKTLDMGPPPEGGLYGLLNQEPDYAQDGTQASPSMDRILSYKAGTPNFGFDENSSNAPYVWDSSTNAQVGRWPTNLADTPGGEHFVGKPMASADFSHFVFSSNVVFAPGGTATTPEAVQPGKSKRILGMWAAPASIYDNDVETGEVHLASVFEGADFAGVPLDVSDDGKVIVMGVGGGALANPPAPSRVVVRVDHTESYELGSGHDVTYLGSTGDGRTAYFISPDRLTPDDQDQSPDLYMWSEDTPESVTLISGGDGAGAGQNDDCSVPWVAGCGIRPVSFRRYSELQGGLGGNGTSDNFIAPQSGDIYFYSPEQLEGAKGEFGQVNLYVYRGGQVHFVTVLSDTPFCTEDQFEPICSEGPIARMQVSPNGAHAAFVTASQVTAYDNAGHGEMYTYEPEAERMLCASCIPSGAPPTADVYGSQNGLFMTDDGRTFFSTDDALVPRDTNKVRDTYEFAQGRPQLISTGIGPGTTKFSGFNGLMTVPGLVGVSHDGTDAFFATYEVLVSQDHNSQEIKIYDARSGGGYPSGLPAPGCAAADECHGEGGTPPEPVVMGAGADLGKGGNAAPPRKKSKKAKRKHHRKHHKTRRGHAKGKGGAHHG